MDKKIPKYQPTEQGNLQWCVDARSVASVVTLPAAVRRIEGRRARRATCDGGPWGWGGGGAFEMNSTLGFLQLISSVMPYVLVLANQLQSLPILWLILIYLI